MPAPWLRIDPRPATAGVFGAPHVSASRVTTDEQVVGRAALFRLFGCRWLWWAPDQHRAWTSLLQALGGGDGRRVVAPAGIEPAAAAVARGAGATLVEVDLDRESGFPRWDTVAGPAATGHRDAYLVEHRHGRPCPFPSDAHAGLVIEHVSDGLGGTVGGQPVGARGAAMICALGRWPFARSTGVVVGTSDPTLATRLAGRLLPLEHGAGQSGALWRDAAGAEDWLAGCRAAAQVYSSAWRGAGVPVRPLEPAPAAEASWSAYVVAVPDPDALARALEDHGVETRRPVPAGLITRLAAEPNACPGAAAFYRHVIQLPNHPDLGLDDILYVASAVGIHLRESADVRAQGKDTLQGPGTPH